MKILHLADLHLGKTLEGHLRIDEQKQVLAEIIDLACQEQIDLLLIAGDVFDSYNPSAEAEKTFYWFLDQVTAHLNCAVVVIAGNHDQPQRLAAAAPLAFGRGIFIMGTPGMMMMTDEDERSENTPFLVDMKHHVLKIFIPKCGETAAICCLPYISEARLNELVTADISESVTMANDFNLKFQEFFQEAAQEFTADTINLVMAHLFVTGGLAGGSERAINQYINSANNAFHSQEQQSLQNTADQQIYVADNSKQEHNVLSVSDVQIAAKVKQPAAVGGSLGVAATVFPTNAQYIALGHLHRPQQIKVLESCYYAGSPLAYSFSETGYEKIVLVVEIHPQEPAVVKKIPLQSGYELCSYCADNFAAALEWCNQEVNHGYWVNLEIKSVQPLSSEEIRTLHAAHPRLINIKLIFPTIEEKQVQSLAELTVADRFRMFVAKKEGAEADEELVQLFLSLLNEDEEEKTDETD